MDFGQIRPTVEYDRKIRYLDYMENGQRSRGAGFVKLERRDEHCSISLQISGLYRKDHFTRPLLLLGEGGERELCKLQLADGGLKLYMEKLDSHSLDGQGMEYEQLKGIRIPISEGKEILCLWEKSERGRAFSTMKKQEPPKEERAKEAPAGETQTRKEQTGGEQARKEQTGGEQARKEQTGKEQTGKEQTGEEQTRKEQTREVRVGEMQIKNSASAENREEAQPVTTFQEDKWDQLWSIYPHVRPFSDDREYLSLGPGDFVLFPGRYYKLVNNSFLLHGYYNFQHLILTRVRQRDNVRYYIGVPGNLYQKEKKIAVMFGFESFECASEPAGEGDFGYYLIPVEL
ncbi:MAG: DUF6128 domain-containing protein [Muribaculum sp.]|nr:DUF6128 domain-containing protein [Muribaculum sp.]